MSHMLAAMGAAAMIALAGCGEDGRSTEARSTTLSSGVPANAQVTIDSATSSTRPTTTVVRPTTTRPAPTTTRARTATTATTATPTTSPPTTAGGRTVALGQSFTVGVSQPVTVSGPGLTVTFVAVVEDSRCPIGMQCIQAGRAVISVTVRKAGLAPATLAVSNEDPPSTRFGGNTIELVLLTRGEPRIATLRVS